ncbi:MAG TPA: hypothetical protein VF796_13405 [Humisphaera sp.]
MRFELPTQVKQSLAARGVRLHHLLWHIVRDNWHDFSEAERNTLRQQHPRWVPNHARFVGSGGAAQINPDAGESFLYMHRQMITSVNVQLAAAGLPAVMPWLSVPGLNDPDYPVPGRRPSGPADDPKSDAMLATLQERAAAVTDPEVLRQNPLALIGAYVESMVHDFLHMRFAAISPGVMASFPVTGPTNVTPNIPAEFDAPEADWLGHPWSSHVNSDFWKLHGWIDQVVEAWRVARGLDRITWTDTWEGDVPADGHGGHALGMVALTRAFEHPGHHHQPSGELQTVLRTVTGFKTCHIGFDYVAKHNMAAPRLTGL